MARSSTAEPEQAANCDNTAPATKHDEAAIERSTPSKLWFGFPPFLCWPSFPQPAKLSAHLLPFQTLHARRRAKWFAMFAFIDGFPRSMAGWKGLSQAKTLLAVLSSIGMRASLLCALEEALTCPRIAKQLHNTFLFAISLKLNHTSRLNCAAKLGSKCCF